MKEYHLSKYNYCICYNNYWLNYNSFSGKIIKTKSPLSINNVSSEQLKDLEKWGFIYNKGKSELLRMIDLKNVLLFDNQLNITIIPSFSCSFNCCYCYQSKCNYLISGSAISNLLYFVRKNISKYRIVNLSLFGGEPLENFETCFQIAMLIKDVCKRNRKIFNSYVTTNGFYLTENVFEKLVDINCRSIQVTFDGSREYHDKYRTKIGCCSTYDIIYGNIKKIAPLLKKSHAELIVRVNVTSENIGSLKSFLNDFSKDFCDYCNCKLYFYLIKQWSPNKVNSLIVKNQNKLIEVLDKYIVKEGIIINYDVKDILPGGAICFGYNKNSFVFLPDGQISRCTVHIKDEIDGIINAEGQIEHTNYNYIKNTFNYKCKKCKLLGTCFAMKCRYEKCNKNQKYRLLKEYMIIADIQNQIEDWTV